VTEAVTVQVAAPAGLQLEGVGRIVWRAACGELAGRRL
jgi:hypothetical protein